MEHRSSDGKSSIAAHPHIVRLVGLIVAPPTNGPAAQLNTAIALELCDGGDLLSVLRRSHLANSTAGLPVRVGEGPNSAPSVLSNTENDSLELKLTLDSALLVDFANQIASALVYTFVILLIYLFIYFT